jgi:fructose-1,6-bisphosphatase
LATTIITYGKKENIMKMIDKEQSLGGWSRIIATVGQLGTAVAIGMGQPDAAPDMADIASQGETIIASGYALYAQVVLLVGSVTTAWSKFSSVMKKR